MSEGLPDPEERKEAGAPEDIRQPSAPLEEHKDDPSADLLHLEESVSYSSDFEPAGQQEDLLLPGLSQDLLQFPEEPRDDGPLPATQRPSTLHASSIRDDVWTCPICLELLNDPVETPCCNNLFCEVCVESLLKCPLCQRVLDKCQPNVPIRRLMNELSVACPYQDCTCVIKKPALKVHVATCDYAPLKCDFGGDLCGDILRKDLSTHLLETCNYRPVSCPLDCGAVLEVCVVEGHVETSCPNANISCPLECGSILRRGELEAHKKTDCPNSLVKCGNVSGSGQRCPTSCLRRELDEHQLVCNFRKVTCPHSGCSLKVVYCQLNEHDKVCSHRVIPCPNDCGYTAKRGVMSEHQAEMCPKQVLLCPFSHCGCGSSVVRADLTEHLTKDAVTHSLLAADKVEMLSRDMIRLKNDLELLRSNHRDELRSLYAEIRKLKTVPHGRGRPFVPEEEALLLPGDSNNAFDEFLRGLDPMGD